MSNDNYVSRNELTARVGEARTAGLEEGKALGIEAGALAERARIKTILMLPEARARANSARALAFDTDMLPEMVATILAGLPEERPQTSIPSLAQRHADAGGGAGPEGPGGAEAAKTLGGGLMKRAAAKVADRRAGKDEADAT